MYGLSRLASRLCRGAAHALVLALATLAACNGSTDSEPDPPTLASISPDTATLGRTGVLVTATGADFRRTSVIQWNGAPLATTFVSGTRLQATLPDALLRTAGAAQVTVLTPEVGASAARTFTVRLPATISVCEVPSITICGTWTLQPSGQYLGSWADGATANLTVATATSGQLVVNRADFGKNHDFSAVYLGTLTGRSAAGTVAWNHAGAVFNGTWTAQW